MSFFFHAAITYALVGLIWTVQIVIYPLFAAIGADAFHRYHARYMRCITRVVGPLMVAELGTAAYLFFDGERSVWFLVSLAALALIWISTAALQVPLHRALERGFTTTTHERLVHTNWLRTLAWSLRGLCLFAIARPIL